MQDSDHVKLTKRKPLHGAAAMGAGPGRPKGIPNKMTMAVKDAIAGAAEKLGGMNRLAEWAAEDPLNERAFWATIYPKLLPLQVSGAVNLTFQKVERAIVDAVQDAQA